MKLFAVLLVLAGLVAVTAAAGVAYGLPAALLVGGVAAVVVGLLLPDGGPDANPPA